MATKYWALVIDNVVSSISTEDLTGKVHESIRIIPASADVVVGQAVTDSGEFLPVEPPTGDSSVADRAPEPAPALSPEEIAEAIEKANSAPLAEGLSLELAERHLV